MGPCQTQLFEQTKAVNLQRPAEFIAPILNEAPALNTRIEDYKTGLEITLSSIFPTKQDENKLQKARRILGDIAVNIPDQELESNLTEFQYLIDSWLDEFERQVFNNKTLNEVLKEG